MKKFLYIAIIGILIWSCGGDGDDLPPTQENKAPSTPVQLYPANNDECIDNAVNFKWDASTDPNNGDIISYFVEVAKNSSFSPLLDSKTVSSTSITIPLEKGTTFYWRITAKDNKGLNSPLSSINKFYTEGVGVSNSAPSSPKLESPKLNDVAQVGEVVLEWDASDPNPGDVLSYSVYFDTVDPPVAKFPTEISTKKHTVTTTAGKHYYWKIVVNDNKGGKTIGQVWNFVTK